MAEPQYIPDEDIKKIDSQLKCPICKDYLKEPPKLLPCFHTFCQSPCLERLVIHHPNGQSLTCPTCRNHVFLSNGVAGLQTDFDIRNMSDLRRSVEKAAKTDCENCETEKAVNYCQHCMKLLCKECTEMHHKWGDFRNHKVLAMDEVKANPTTLTFTDHTPKCERHNLDATIHCESCCRFICNKCTLGVHSSHKFDNGHKVKDELEKQLQSLKEKLQRVEDTLQEFNPIANEVNNLKGNIKEKIDTNIEKQHKLLKKKQEELTESLEDHIGQKMRDLATQTDTAEHMCAAIQGCLNYIKRRLEGQEHDMLRMKEPILERLKEIAEFQLEDIKPTTKGSIRLITDDDHAHTAIRENGEIVTEKTVHVKNCYADGGGSKYAVARMEASLTVYAKTRQDTPCEQKLDITATLEHTDCEITEKGNGQYEITYLAYERGNYNLCIKINGKHIRDSPYPIAIIPSPKSLKEPLRVVELQGPSGVTTNSKMQLLIENSGNISVLSPEGEKISSFATEGSGKLASGVTVDLDDNIYVVDNDNNRIQKFTFEGKFLAAVGSKGSSLLEFDSPVGICFNRTNRRLYVCDRLNHRVQAIPTSLTLVRSFQIGEKGNKEGQFQNPICAALDSNNNLYVTDFGNNRVQVFTGDGEFVRSFSHKADGKTLDGPFAIAIGTGNIVYVSEWEKHCVSVFTSQGDYITSFGMEGNKKGHFNKIRGLCIDQNNYIIVSDSSNNRLQVF